MANRATSWRAPTRTSFDVYLGKAEKPLGRLIFVKDGQREFSQFAYSDEWLADAQCFDSSPDLRRRSGYQLRKPPTGNDSSFVWRRPSAVIKDKSLRPQMIFDHPKPVDYNCG
jgi:hypothetical protein